MTKAGYQLKYTVALPSHNMQKPTRESVLAEISKAVLIDRNNAYGSPEDSFGTIAHLWALYLDARMQKQADGTVTVLPLKAHDVAAMMMLFKVARISKNPSHIDSWADAGGYAVCGAEVAPEAAITQNEMPFAETCKAASQPRAFDSLLSPTEAMVASRMAHQCRSVTIAKLQPEDQALVDNTILFPTQLAYGQFIRLSQLLGVEATK